MTSSVTVLKSGPVPLVSFDFRFARDSSEHSGLLEIRTSLALQFAQKREYAANIESLRFYPVQRAGKSGSEVFYLDLYNKTTDYPRRYIAKFQSIKETKKEHKSSLDASHAQLCGEVHIAEDDKNDIGMIVCDLAKIPNHCEFRTFFLDLSKSDADCATALRSVFQVVGRYPNSKSAPKPLIEDFSWYVDRKTKPLERIRSLKITEPRHSVIADIAESIEGNFLRIESELNHPVYPYLVHGDLHARNLMLSIDDPAKTELIDFGWVHYGHPAKDFVLMECTLKYMLLQEFLPLVHKSVTANTLYMPLAVFERFESFLCERGLNLPSFADLETELNTISGVFSHHILALRRVYESLIEVRKAAAIVLQKYCDNHLDVKSSAQQQYFASLFLVVLGLSSFSEMEPIWTLVGLRTIGDHIWTM